MLEIGFIREHRTEVLDRLGIKNFKNPEWIDEILFLDAQKRQVMSASESLASNVNQLSRQVGELIKNGQSAEAETIKQRVADQKAESKNLQHSLQETDQKLYDLLIQIPNLAHASVPRGIGAESNEVVYEKGRIPDLYAEAKPHWELAATYRIIDFELGNKITGAGFPVYLGQGAKLQRALIQFFLDQAVAAGFDEVQPPILINAASGFGTGQLPDKEGQMYYVKEDDLYLVPTAEVPVTNLYRDVILKEALLPVKNCAYTPCFRREAGSYGAHVRGLNRLHQFDKVEIVCIAKTTQSYDLLEEMRKHVEELLEKLELPYRLLKLCGGDMGFTSSMTYDLEVYAAAQKKWLEVSSVSNFEGYQANRLKVRFKNSDGKTEPLHTLNGSALALPRIVAALLENNQTKEGIKIPAVLRPYTGFEIIR